MKKIYCYYNDDFITFLEHTIIPRKGEIIRIHRPNKGFWEYEVENVLYIHDLAENSGLNQNYLEDVRIDLINPFNSCKEDQIP